MINIELLHIPGSQGSREEATGDRREDCVVEAAHGRRHHQSQEGGQRRRRSEGKEGQDAGSKGKEGMT